MTPKQVSLNHSALPTSPKGINLVKNLHLTLALPQAASVGQAIPPQLRPCALVSDTLCTLFFSALSSFSPG